MYHTYTIILSLLLLLLASIIYLAAANTFLISASISRAFNLGNGLFKSNNCNTFLLVLVIVTTNAPLRGFSALIDTFRPLPLHAVSIFIARDLNAFQDLQASIATSIESSDFDEEAFDSETAFDTDLLEVAFAALALVDFLGPILLELILRANTVELFFLNLSMIIIASVISHILYHIYYFNSLI